jgi:uncharacterized protein YprB with RNaseH-like and TPR domain
MSDVRDRLRVLQRQAGRIAVEAPDPARESIRVQLKRLLARRSGVRRSLAPPAGVEVGEGLHLVERRERATYAPTLVLPWHDEGPASSERFVCFDTETTGLAGGVGTKAFMIGTAQWQGDALLTRQLYLTAMRGEAAMLGAFADALPADAILRRAHPFDALPHVDLLHPTRRAYRGMWENCRLATIERHVLGVVRDDDLPGSEAPGAWRAFLRGLESRSLDRVLTHNRIDLTSLASLLAHFGESAVEAA